jgi:hypothetical protein
MSSTGEPYPGPEHLPDQGDAHPKTWRLVCMDMASVMLHSMRNRTAVILHGFQVSRKAVRK